MLLGKEEKVLQGMIGRPTETGRCCRLEMNVVKTKDKKISGQPPAVQIVIDQK